MPGSGFKPLVPEGLLCFADVLCRELGTRKAPYSCSLPSAAALRTTQGR